MHDNINEKIEFAVETFGLSHNYGKVSALINLNLQIKKGELFGCIGPDGAGKTTLFRILTSLLIPQNGWAKVEGLNSVNDYKKIRSIIGYMPGRFSLYQDLTVEENLNFFASVFGTSIKQNYELIKDIYVQIEPFKKRRAGALSGGMKQKLALCCALIHRPELLILDEPTTGVDPVSRKEFWEMLKKLQKQDITIVVSTPYMDETALCDRVALMQDGKILAIDNPAEIVSNHKEHILAVKAANRYKLMQDLKQHPACKSVFTFGEFLHFTLKQGVEPESIKIELEKQLSPKHHELIVKPAKINIEDCFMSLMQEGSKISGTENE